MEKLREALNTLSQLDVRIDGIKELSFILWDSIANGGFEIAADAHGSAAYLLSTEIEAIYDALQDIEEMLCDGLKEVKV